MRKSKNQIPERGDLICVEWVDIFEDPTGDPSSGDVSLRSSYSLFWDITFSKKDPHLQILRTTNTIDKEDLGQQGFVCYPMGAVRQITVLKKARGNSRTAIKANTGNGTSGGGSVPLEKVGREGQRTP